MFYDVIESNSKTDYWIKWKTEIITSGKSGFIIQHMTIKSHLDCIKNDDYWEAWQITDGKIITDEDEYDDNWSPLPDCFVSYFKESIDKSKDGVVVYSSKVYFVPIESSIYKEIEKWEVVKGSPANELPMTYIFEMEMGEFYIGSREHKWDYKNLT